MTKVYTLSHCGGEYEDRFEYVICASLDRDILVKHIGNMEELHRHDPYGDDKLVMDYASKLLADVKPDELIGYCSLNLDYDYLDIQEYTLT